MSQYQYQLSSQSSTIRAEKKEDGPFVRLFRPQLSSTAVLHPIQHSGKHMTFTLLRETVVVYCKNHIEHTNTLRTIRKDAVRTSHATHYVSATKSNRLMLFAETVAVYYENHKEQTDTLPNNI
jgi:hypothetical protein